MFLTSSKVAVPGRGSGGRSSILGLFSSSRPPLDEATRFTPRPGVSLRRNERDLRRERDLLRDRLFLRDRFLTLRDLLRDLDRFLLLRDLLRDLDRFFLLRDRLPTVRERFLLLRDFFLLRDLLRDFFMRDRLDLERRLVAMIYFTIGKKTRLFFVHSLFDPRPETPAWARRLFFFAINLTKWGRNNNRSCICLRYSDLRDGLPQICIQGRPHIHHAGST